MSENNNEEEYWMEGVEEEEFHKKKRVIAPEKDRTGLGFAAGLFFSIIIGWIFGLCFPPNSDEQVSFFRAWGISSIISVIITIIILVLVL